MKKSLILAAFFAVGASAAGAGAAVNFATSPYVGSDTEYNITNQAILNSGLGNQSDGPTSTPWNAQTNPLGDYSGGGSGGAETAMAGAKQQTGPMSRMLAGGPGKGACAAADVTQASGVVLAIDAVGLWASNAVISANQTACNGASNAGQCTQVSSGLVFSGGPLGFGNWRDVLALLYGGLDRTVSPNVVNCASSKRQQLVSQWTNLFQNSSCTNVNGTALTHAWRRDDNSGTADVFSNLIGLQSANVDQFGNATAKFNLSANAVNGFGTSPYCNALNWDTTEAAALPAACVNSADTHYVGPGGVPVAASADAHQIHHVPPPSTYGTQPLGTQPFVLPTSYQDNDPIRTACLGNGSAGRAGEDVCNDDGQLGIVVPVPALDFIHIQNPGLQSFPSTLECKNGTAAADAPKVFSCAPRNKGTTVPGLCPNNDKPLGIGCLVPKAANAGGFTTQCIATLTEHPACFTGPCGNQLPGKGGAIDGRVYNLQAYDGNGNGTSHYLNVTYAVNNAAGSFTASLNMAGGFGRVHMREMGAGGLYPCQLDDATDQIGCLVQADAMSVGFGGNTAGTWEQRDPLAATTGSGATAPNTQGVRVNQLEPGIACVPAAPGSGLVSYPLWRKLYFSSIVGFSRVTSTNELNLGEFESEAHNMNTGIILPFGFFKLPFSPNGTDSVSGDPAPFCEDFNESLSANCAASTNQNACGTNFVGGAPAGGALTAAAFGTIPSDPSTVPANATKSTVCGNGLLEQFEDCDPNAAAGVNPPTCGTCSATCRCSN